ncbi:Imm52 family immunity protein, partial [Photorhabdus heterorhabditis]|uniref:Imm52 family immunity protein n=1 Tax=Photorhabdus heterorhabditis TaxID=880156 RepID=UPI0015628C96
MHEISFSIKIKENSAKDFNILCDTFGFFLKEINKCDKNVTTLYAKGETLEEALQHKIIDLTGVIHPEAREIIGDNLPYVAGLWDGKMDKSISIMIMDEVDKIESDILIGAENHIGVYNKNNLVDFIKSIANKYTLQYCSISFNGKGTGDKVFPDRPAVGWMIYLPVHIEEGYLNIAEDVIPVSTELNTGTIIV